MGSDPFFLQFFMRALRKKTAKKTAQLRFSAVLTRQDKQQTGLTPIIFAAALLT
jgi:hypothetical protein